MDTSGVIQLTVLALLLLLSAFFSSAETALSTVNRIRVRALLEEGNRRAVVLQKVLDRYSKMLSAILIGNNLVNISASSLVTALVIRHFGSACVGLFTGLLTMLILLFGEIVPKNWARVRNETIALLYSKPIYALMTLLTPVIFLVDRLSGLFLRLLHIDLNEKALMTERELRTYVDVSHEEGVIESEEREIIHNVFDFSDALAKDIMVPRIDMVMVEADDSYEEVMRVFRESMYTRLPVYQETTENVIGLINVKDLLLLQPGQPFHVRQILRDAYYTYEYKKTADLLLEIRESTSSVVFVLNEYGATVGMITQEDLLEEIVGEIRDEYDEDEQYLIQKAGEREYLVAGGVKLSDLNDALGTALSSEDYDSVGGIVIELLDRLPENGDQVTTPDGVHIQVLSMRQNRIERVRITLPEAEAEEGASEGDGETEAPEDDR